MNRSWRFTAAVTVFALLLAFGGCNRDTNVSMLETSESESVDTSTENSESETTETSKSEPTGFEDYIDETVPNHKKVIKHSEGEHILLTEFYDFGGIYLGYGNPVLLKAVRKYYSDETINTEDIPWYTSKVTTENEFKLFFFEIGGDNPNTKDIEIGHDLDFIRYILEENGLRLWVDEIPYEFFEEKFPEYVKECNQGGYRNLHYKYDDYDLSSHGYDGFLKNLDYKSGNIEMIKMACFMCLTHYNAIRDTVAASMDALDDQATKYGCIETGKTPDGKYVWCLTEPQYKRISYYTHKLLKCKNVDVLVPETRQDLIDSHVRVDQYDEMTEKVFGGAKI